MTTTAHRRSSSPSPTPMSRRAYSPLPSPTPFLTPPSERPIPRRLLSLQTSSRPQPYPSPSPSPPPIPSHAFGGPKRPSAPRRSHSFCASGPNSTYALASASPAGHLTPDKRAIVAPPLERTLSSIGSRGNCSPTEQQMQRPLPDEGMGELDLTTPTKASFTREVLRQKDVNGGQHTTPTGPKTLPSPTPLIPTITIEPSLTPPRPSLSTMRTPSNTSSRSSSYTTVATPTTPRGMLFGRIDEGQEEPDELEEYGSGRLEDFGDFNEDVEMAYEVQGRKAGTGYRGQAEGKENVVEGVAREVDRLAI
ncbi:hypothetical protein IAT38_008041 [Cryptococcus sp. DSM 104549]